MIVAKPIWQLWSRQPAPKKPQDHKWLKLLLAGTMLILEPRFILAALPFPPAQQPYFITLAFMAGAAMRLLVLLPCHHRPWSRRKS